MTDIDWPADVVPDLTLQSDTTDQRILTFIKPTTFVANTVRLNLQANSLTPVIDLCWYPIYDTECVRYEESIHHGFQF